MAQAFAQHTAVSDVFFGCRGYPTQTLLGAMPLKERSGKDVYRSKKGKSASAHKRTQGARRHGAMPRQANNAYQLFCMERMAEPGQRHFLQNEHFGELTMTLPKEWPELDTALKNEYAVRALLERQRAAVEGLTKRAMRDASSAGEIIRRAIEVLSDAESGRATPKEGSTTEALVAALESADRQMPYRTRTSLRVCLALDASDEMLSAVSGKQGEDIARRLASLLDRWGVPSAARPCRAGSSSAHARPPESAEADRGGVPSAAQACRARLCVARARARLCVARARLCVARARLCAAARAWSAHARGLRARECARSARAHAVRARHTPTVRARSASASARGRAASARTRTQSPRARAARARANARSTRARGPRAQVRARCSRARGPLGWCARALDCGACVRL